MMSRRATDRLAPMSEFDVLARRLRTIPPLTADVLLAAGLAAFGSLAPDVGTADR
jgi:MprA protease rhombosortase-interaction domain-containing protein